MPRLRRNIEVHAPAERAWAVLGDLVHADRWIPGITRVQVEGTSKRVCTFADGHVQHEEIAEYSPERRSYRYSIEGTPGMRRNRGTFAVEDRTPGSVVHWESEFEVLDAGQEAQVTTMWNDAMRTVLDSLRRVIEQGG